MSILRTFAIILLTFAAGTSPAAAHSGATGVVKERMELMKGMGKQMKRMGAMAKGKQPYEAAAFVEGAQVILDGTPKVNALFPEGSNPHPSEALPRIWQEWPKFEASNEKLLSEAEKLLRVAESGEQRAVIGQFARVGKVCGSCHKRFRKKKEE